MKKSQHIALMVFVFAFVLCAKAQDTRFTQTFYSNPLKLNPAIMGMNSDFKAMLNYRSQWGSVDKGYTTYSFTGLYPLFMKEGKEKLDIGLNVLSDKEGAFSTMDASLAIGYNLKVSNSGYLSFSLLGGFVQKSLDASSLYFDDQYVLGAYNSSNPTSQTNILSEKASYPDVGFGLMWYYNPSDDDAKLNAYAGLSGYHLNEPNETFTDNDGKLPRKLSFQGGVKIIGENKIDFTPNIVANVQGGAEEFAGGLLIDFRFNENAKLIFGAWYRKQDAYPVMIGFEHKNFLFNYSYDITSSELSRAVSGLSTHEITLAFKLNMAEKKGVESAPSIF